MKTSTGFKAILDERRRTLMSRELVVLRDAIVSDSIDFVHIRKFGPPGSTEPDGGSQGVHDLFDQTSRYIAEASWGWAALIHKGLVPRVPKSLAQVDVARAVKASSGKDAQSLKFIEELDHWLATLEHTEDDFMRQIGQERIDKGIDHLEPLSIEMQKEAEKVSASPSLALMEAFRSRGQQLRFMYGIQSYMDAETVFAQAELLEGSDHTDMMLNAESAWLVATMCEEFHSAAFLNIAASHLEQKYWTSAIEMSQKALLWLKYRQSDPNTFELRRANVLHKFQHGEYARFSETSKLRPFDELDTAIHKELEKSAWRKIGAGWDGMCRERLAEDLGDANSHELVEHIYDDAARAYLTSYNVDPSDKTVLDDLAALTKAKEHRLNEDPDVAAVTGSLANVWTATR